MDIDSFWKLIEHSRGRARGRAGRLAWLRDELARKPMAEIVGFQVCLDRLCEQGFTWELWCAAERIFGGWCSDDSFCYFRLWVVGLGRTMFERAVRDPDTLAEAPEVLRLVGRPRRSWDDDWPEWEELDYVANYAHEQVTGVPHTDVSFYRAVAAGRSDDVLVRNPLGVRWDVRDEPEATRRLPRLSSQFPITTQP
ncbi:DUF4240 domain-containing protein [Streptomyces sp. NPDC060366]|uniref:DUF4240 domain-containing protein n=1 Tax=Streptomyces sp. NPDC060366 TaxID=3347105 RepID=UPI0036518C81